MLTIDFNKFDKKGMKKVLDLFDKAALPISDVEADNKAKREAGYSIKQATITFESGQVLLLKIKAEGSLYQAKLNGKVLAIKNYIKPDSFMDEVIGYAKDNEPNYLKQKEKAALKQRVAVPTIKPVNTTVAEQSQQFQATLDALKGQNETAQNEITALAPVVTEKQGALTDLNKQISTANSLSEELTAKLEKVKQGIFESAAAVNSCPECGTAMDACSVEKNADGEMTDGSRCPKCGTETDGDGVILECGDAVAATCPECGATMTECDGGGMECPECNCKTDSDGVILESGCKKVDILESAIYESSPAFQEAKKHNYPFTMNEKQPGKLVLRDFNTGEKVSSYEGPFFATQGDAIMYTWMDSGERNISALTKEEYEKKFAKSEIDKGVA